jgi:hypothetical protein
VKWEKFELGFWHPFGPHGRESALDILGRKRDETEKNGWTLWSFQYRKSETLDRWYRELSSAKPRGPVVVFCSRSSSTTDPDRPGSSVKTFNCSRYKFVNQEDWHPVPDMIKVPHPFQPGKTIASAFVVRRVHPLKIFQCPAAEWFSKNEWHDRKIPTRDEYLIRQGGRIRMREVCAVLELKPPYLAIVQRTH